MTAVLIGANVLLDVMTENAAWFAWSSEAITNAADRCRLVINPVIYAEVSVRFSRIEALDAALPRSMFDREAVSYEAAFLAGKSFLLARRSGQKLTDVMQARYAAMRAAIARGTRRSCMLWATG